MSALNLLMVVLAVAGTDVVIAQSFQLSECTSQASCDQYCSVDTQCETCDAVGGGASSMTCCGITSDTAKGWNFREETGSHYYVSDYAATYVEAYRICRFLGANLARITDNSENDDIGGLLDVDGTQVMGQGEEYWIGLTDETREGCFKFAGTTTVADFIEESLDTEIDNTNTSGPEDCVVVIGNTGNWDERQCGLSKRFICKRQTPPFPPRMPPVMSPVLQPFTFPTNLLNLLGGGK